MKRPDAEILWEVATVLAREARVIHPAARALPPLLFFTDPDRTPRPWETADRLPAGAGVVFRHFGRPDARETAHRLAEVAARRDLVLLVGLDEALAVEVGARGVHLPERALARAPTLRAARPDWILTAAAHAPTDDPAVGALDALVVSPVFPAGGRSAGTPALGVPGLRALAAAVPRPVHALGGINAKTAPGLIGSGACGLAAVSAIRSAFGP